MKVLLYIPFDNRYIPFDILIFRVQASDVMLKKFFCAKYLIDNHSTDFQTSNSTKECQFNRAKPREVKSNSLKISKPTVKARSIANFLLTKVESCSSRSTRANIGELHYTEKGALTRQGLSNLV